MALILHLETATAICSVALSSDGRLLGQRESEGTGIHSRSLLPYVDELLKEHGCSVMDLSAVSVSMGPGSYTGLRIGLSAAKGLCYGAGIPLLAIGTLFSMAAGAAEHPLVLNSGQALLCPMIDARRMEVYCSLFDHKLTQVEAPAAVVVDETFAAKYRHNRLIIFGDGAAKCFEILSAGGEVRMIPGFKPSAAHQAAEALNRYRLGNFADTAYCEPFYLKEFVAGKPNVKGLK